MLGSVGYEVAATPGGDALHFSAGGGRGEFGSYVCRVRIGPY